MAKGPEWHRAVEEVAPAVVVVATAIAVADATVAANENSHKWH
jgi:hypothetical protein